MILYWQACLRLQLFPLNLARGGGGGGGCCKNRTWPEVVRHQDSHLSEACRPSAAAAASTATTTNTMTTTTTATAASVSAHIHNSTSRMHYMNQESEGLISPKPEPAAIYGGGSGCTGFSV